MRADVFLFEKGFAKSRARARVFIESGNVTINGKTVLKPSEQIDESVENIVLISAEERYVSRGGLKLEKALNVFKIDVSGKCCLDVGASTGGFTDCLLKHGASKVYAVDSGSGQLVPELINDERVVNIEKYNARNLKKGDFSVSIDTVVIDVSFISQTLIIPGIADVLYDGGIFVSLIKPQFEAGRGSVGKNGIVKDKKDRLFAAKRVIECAESFGFGCFGFDVSPIQGGNGNIEYIAAFEKGRKSTINDNVIQSVIYTGGV